MQHEASDDFLKAVQSGDTEAVAALLRADAGRANKEYRFEDVPLSPLYFACMADRPAVVKQLLQAGANTQDGESIYHAAQHNRVACLELMLAHGANLSDTQAPYGNTPLYFLVGHHSDENGTAAWLKGLTWLLEHGADPNVASYRSQEAPLHGIAGSPWKLKTARALLRHGADVNLRRGDGMTPYQLAVRRGNAEMATLLANHGADVHTVQPSDEFLFAALTGDRERARAILHEHPGLIEALPPEDQAAVTNAVMHERPDAVRLMVDLGFRLDREMPGGGTPAHWAAWHGKPAMVKLLVELGAPVNMRDSQYGASPLGWAAHGSEECRRDADNDYCAIVDTLVDAGATREATVNKWGEMLSGSPAVAKRLKERLGKS